MFNVMFTVTRLLGLNHLHTQYMVSQNTRTLQRIWSALSFHLLYQVFIACGQSISGFTLVCLLGFFIIALLLGTLFENHLILCLFCDFGPCLLICLPLHSLQPLPFLPSDTWYLDKLGIFALSTSISQMFHSIKCTYKKIKCMTVCM